MNGAVWMKGLGQDFAAAFAAFPGELPDPWEVDEELPLDAVLPLLPVPPLESVDFGVVLSDLPELTPESDLSDLPEPSEFTDFSAFSDFSVLSTAPSVAPLRASVR